MFLIGFAGLSVGIGSVIGVHAAQKSLRETKQKWEAHIDTREVSIPFTFPRAYGLESSFTLGRLFPYVMTVSFVFMWLVYLGLLAEQFLQLTMLI